MSIFCVYRRSLLFFSVQVLVVCFVYTYVVYFEHVIVIFFVHVSFVCFVHVSVFCSVHVPFACFLQISVVCFLQSVVVFFVHVDTSAKEASGPFRWFGVPYVFHSQSLYFIPIAIIQGWYSMME